MAIVSDPLVLVLASLFMFLQIWMSLRFLWQKRGQGRTCIALSANSFLLLALLAILLSFLWMFVIGLDRALAAFALGSGVVLSFLDPLLAICFFIVNLFLRPWELMAPNALMTSLPRVLGLVCILSWCIFLWQKGNPRLLWNKSFSLAVLFIVWIFIASVLSGTAAQRLPEIFAQFLPTVVVCFLLFNLVDDKETLDAVKSTLVLAVTAYIILALYMTLSDTAFLAGGLRLYGPGGPLGNSNDLAAVIVMVFPMALSPLAFKGAGLSNKYAAFVVCLILLAGLWLSQSRGALLSVVSCAAFYMLFCQKRFGKSVLLAAALLLLAALIFANMDRDASDVDESGQSRLNYALAGFKMLKSSPIWGVGPGNYPVNYAQYSSLFLEEGVRTAHSSWVLAMAETGLPGLVLFVSIFISVFRKAWCIRKEYPEYILALISYGTAMSFLSHTYLIYPYLLFSLILAASRVYSGSD